MFWSSKPRRNQGYQQRRSTFEALENRKLMAADITSWIDTSGGVLYIGGGNVSDNIQIRFEKGQIGVRDGASNQIIKIAVTDHGIVTQRDSIPRSFVPYYLIVSTGEGSNTVNVIEDAANPAMPLAIYGGQGDDILNGGSAKDAIYGLGGNDRIDGKAGDDYLVGGYGLLGETASSRGDVLIGGAGNDTLIGSSGNDELDGGSGDDNLRGMNGDDKLTGGPGQNSYDGGAGNDRIVEVGLYGAFISDTRLSTTRFNGAWSTNSVIIASIEQAQLSAILGPLTAVGLDASAFSGNTILTGGIGNDTLKGGRGNDQISGGGGDDTISGGMGDNILDGNLGNDTISETSVRGSILKNDLMLVAFRSGLKVTSNKLIGIENATISGGTSTDYVGLRVDATEFSGFTTLIGTQFADDLAAGSGGSWIRGLDGDDILTGGAGRDNIDGGPGNDNITGGIGIDSLNGGTGYDNLFETQLSYGRLTNASLTTRVLEFSLSNKLTWKTEIDSISNFESADLSARPTSIFQGVSGVTLDAANFSGPVKLYGNNGADRLIGGSGADTIRGGAGNDTIWGNGGSDFLFGDEGADTIWGDQEFRGLLDGDDTIEGGAGNDTIYGGGLDDKIYGGADNDNLYGDFVGDNLFDGRDQIFGGSGIDNLFGGGGNDLLFGGAFGDRDNLVGGAGDDLFLVMGTEDVANDFRPNSEDARIRLTADGTQVWTDSQVLQIIPGLSFFMSQTGNTRLLKLSNQKEFEIQRVKDLGTIRKLQIDADNNDLGRIRMADASFASGKMPDAILVHEIAHNWDSESTFWSQWQTLSGWRIHDNRGGSLFPPYGYVLSQDEIWEYKTSANNSIFRDYGKSNPFEDWTTSWEAFYANKNGNLAKADQIRLGSKLSLIEQFVASQRT